MTPFHDDGQVVLYQGDVREAKGLGRRAIGIDLNPAYLELAVRRIGEQLTLVEGGVTSNVP
jgi:hypothetical protein